MALVDPEDGPGIDLEVRVEITCSVVEIGSAGGLTEDVMGDFVWFTPDPPSVAECAVVVVEVVVWPFPTSIVCVEGPSHGRFDSDDVTWWS